MKIWKSSFQVNRTKHISFIIAISLCLSFTATSNTNAALTTRSLVDRPDDFVGYQIHLVHVAVKDSVDSKWDVAGKIDSWIQESQNWLNRQIGRKLLFDTYQGNFDVTHMSSGYSREELCNLKCEGLQKLEKEYVLQNPSYNGSKTVVFVLNEDLDKGYCGWADSPGNFAVLSLGSPRCDDQNALKTYGLAWPAVSLLHELFHTYGIEHKCFDSSDLMIGSPECPNKRASKLVTLDSKKNQYVGSESSDGIDLLKLPIWQKRAGDDSYSKIPAISKDRYIPKLRDGKIYAIVGEKSEKFEWQWGKNLYPSGPEVSCQLISDVSSIVGTVKGPSCVFDVPSNMRPGKTFTVIQKWVKGPWNGQESITGTFVRSDYSSGLCTFDTCVIGQTTMAQYSCWESKIKTLTLQQLVKGRWIDIKTVATETGSRCKTDASYTHYPSTQLEFKQIGYFIYRWFVPAQGGYRSYSDEPFAVVVNEEQSPEPSGAATEMANRKAIELGRAADLADKQGGKAALDLVADQQAQASAAITNQLASDLRKIQDSEAASATELKAKQEAEAKATAELKAKQEAAEKAAALKKTTIVCVKGKLTKKVTAVKPKCPAGYKLKK
jgi:hypothetical protein